MRVLPSGDAVTRIGEWELALEIASHESTVFVARRPGPRSFSRWVAVRYVGPFLGDDATLGDAIVDDARRASQLSHPCVLTVHDAGTALGGRFIVTDYVEGGTLAELFDAGRVETEVLGSIAIDVLSGLAAIHAATDGAGRSLSFVHGRVSPRNVVVGLDGRARIADLGLARLGRRDADGDAFASFHYAAPEVLRGAPADARADVFSVGMLLYEGLAGRHPYADAASAKEAAARLEQPMPLLSVASPRVPAPLAAAIARAIAPDPEMRYRSADAFSAALEAAGMRAAARAVEGIATERLGPSVRARREACHAWSRASGPPQARPRPWARAVRRARRWVRRWVRRRQMLVIAALLVTLTIVLVTLVVVTR